MHTNKVFLLGVFDLFHVGHLNILYKGAQLGDLTVGIVVDDAVKKQKGPNRPIIPFEQRKGIILGMGCVKGVITLNDFEIPNHVLYDFNIIVVGEDQKHIKNLDQIPHMKRYHLPRTVGVSTSDIIKRIKSE